MSVPSAPVHRSVSTWQQPVPASTTAERAALLDRIAGRILALGPGRLRVGVDGLTAAGKTTFAHELAVRISAAGRPVLRASLDDFKRPWRERHRYDRESGPGYYRNAFDCAAIRRLLLEPAGASGSGRCVLCLIDPLTQLDHSSLVTTAGPDAVTIVDGVFAFRPELDDLWEHRIWLDVPAELSVRRGVDRDAGRTGAAEAEALHRDRYLAAHRHYLADADPLPRVDVIVDNADVDRPRLRRG
ncbi:uridine kinase [Micromonospora echinaurantiaca]|uniref:Uridine kinase n=1 Tax=Micromonospora echinaurantiaca TaxID=47857 RepID=A0A1C5J0F9_9ACTN|nr:uridine kinase [Micromonospora echinaurantiaca]SCG63629.1 uridine kinase [Micromonospora echinaurantiaca]